MPWSGNAQQTLRLGHVVLRYYGLFHSWFFLTIFWVMTCSTARHMSFRIDALPRLSYQLALLAAVFAGIALHDLE